MMLQLCSTTRVFDNASTVPRCHSMMVTSAFIRPPSADLGSITLPNSLCDKYITVVCAVADSSFARIQHNCYKKMPVPIRDKNKFCISDTFYQSASNWETYFHTKTLQYLPACTLHRLKLHKNWVCSTKTVVAKETLARVQRHTTQKKWVFYSCSGTFSFLSQADTRK